jgi:hypothetical protein
VSVGSGHADTGKQAETTEADRQAAGGKELLRNGWDARCGAASRCVHGDSFPESTPLTLRRGRQKTIGHDA